MGRKNIYEKKIKSNLDKIIEWRREKDSYLTIAKKLGISEKTFYTHLKKEKDFQEALETGEKCIEEQIKSRLIDLCTGGIKKEKKILVTEGFDENGKPIVKQQRVEVEETLPSFNAIRYYLDKRDGSYNTYNNSNSNEEVGTYEHLVKGSNKEKEALSIRLQNIVKGMDKSTKEGTGES
jgi:hypothetical protein